MVGRLYLTDQGFSFAAKAIATISGGQIVKAMSGANVLTSTNAVGEIVEVDLADAVGDIGIAVGVATNTGVSGDRIGVATTGVHGFYASEAITAGWGLVADGTVASADAVARITVGATSGAEARFGKALTYAASGQLCAVKLG